MKVLVPVLGYISLYTTILMGYACSLVVSVWGLNFWTCYRLGSRARESRVYLLEQPNPIHRKAQHKVSQLPLAQTLCVHSGDKGDFVCRFVVNVPAKTRSLNGFKLLSRNSGFLCSNMIYFTILNPSEMLATCFGRPILITLV